MATAEQIQQLLHQQTEWMRQMQEQQAISMKMLFDQLLTVMPTTGGLQTGFQELDERSFREPGKFEGQDESIVPTTAACVCGLECDAGAWQTVVRKRQKARRGGTARLEGRQQI